MPQSLSIVLPVRDAQDSLRGTAEGLLEMVPELTDDFEVLIVDDASNDATEEVARDLAAEYPQMRVIRHRCAQGLTHAAETGVGQCRGDVIFIKDDASPIRSSDLLSLWDMRTDEQLVMARSEPAPPTPAEVKPLDRNLISRLMSWGASLDESTTESQGRIQMIRREAVEQMQHGDEGQRTDPLVATPVTASVSTAPAIPSSPNTPPGVGPMVSRSEQILRRMPPRPVPSGMMD